MNTQYIVWLGIAAVLAVLGFSLLKRRKELARGLEAAAAMSSSMVGDGPSAEVAQPMAARPHAIMLGDDARHPGVQIALLSDENRFRSARAVPVESGLGGRLSAGLQAIPSLLVEEGHRGKQLMEVVINGDLVRAKDGVGLRAWAVGSDKKISEHAKLFEVDNLQSAVNAAAVWQVASVVVAQKHLADISAKLDDIREGVHDVARFLDEARRAKITGTYEYLELASSAIAKGELSPTIRDELESSERQLLQIQHHLQQELERRCSEDVSHNEFAGTDDLEKQSIKKYVSLSDVAKDMRLTLKTRALAWYVFSLYPGEQALKEARKEGILRSVAELEERIQTIERSAERDAAKITSFWNRETTLTIRKTNVREAALALAGDLGSSAAQVKEQVKSSTTALLTHDIPTHLVFEIEDGRISDFRMLERVPLAA